jgi:hypothetical protein
MAAGACKPLASLPMIAPVIVERHDRRRRRAAIGISASRCGQRGARCIRTIAHARASALSVLVTFRPRRRPPSLNAPPSAAHRPASSMPSPDRLTRSSPSRRGTRNREAQSKPPRIGSIAYCSTERRRSRTTTSAGIPGFRRGACSPSARAAAIASGETRISPR